MIVGIDEEQLDGEEIIYRLVLEQDSQAQLRWTFCCRVIKYLPCLGHAECVQVRVRQSTSICS